MTRSLPYLCTDLFFKTFYVFSDPYQVCCFFQLYYIYMCMKYFVTLLQIGQSLDCNRYTYIQITGYTSRAQQMLVGARVFTEVT